MENTLENKAKFFALYLDQEIYFIKGWNRGRMILDAHKLVKEEFKYLEKSYIELTPLSQITDEHAIEVAKIIWNNSSNHTIQEGKLIVAHFEIDKGLFSPLKMLKAFYYLISKGYYIGDGTEVSFGWAKLKEG